MKKTLLMALMATLLGACQSMKTAPDTDDQPATISEESALPALPDPNEADLPPVEVVDAEIPLPAEPAGFKDIWARLRADSVLAFSDNSRIRHARKRYLIHPDNMGKHARKSEPYLHYVIEQLEKRNMPVELALLPMVESNYDPLAHSRSRAAGLWQFMPATARHFGLHRDDWYDGRRDIVASTGAALDYFEYLEKRFDGDWLLAVAAYNGGEGNVRRAIRRNLKAGKPPDYWSLKLPRETMRYVPRLLALTQIVRDPEHFGVALPALPDAPYFVEVPVEQPLNLGVVAQLAAVDVTEFLRLNPAFDRLYVPGDRPVSLLIPVDSVEAFLLRMEQAPSDKLSAHSYYEVQNGDNLGKIAGNHGISVPTLKSLNGLNSDLIRPGQTLKLPGATANEAGSRAFLSRLSASRDRQRQTRYRVRRGDSLWKIARKHGVTVKQLTAWNGMPESQVLRPGMKLKVWVRNHKQAGTGKKLTYKVKQGDTLGGISRVYKVAVADLVRWNGLSSKHFLRLGQTLTIYQ